MTPIDIEVSKIVISTSFSLISLTWSSGLAWWLSSFVFVLTLLGKVYPARGLFQENGMHMPVGIFVCFILMSLIIFGIVVIHDLTIMEQHLYEMFIKVTSDFNVPRISYIYNLVRKLYVIVTSSLIVFLIAWIYIWFFSTIPGTTTNGR